MPSKAVKSSRCSLANYNYNFLITKAAAIASRLPSKIWLLTHHLIRKLRRSSLSSLNAVAKSIGKNNLGYQRRASKKASFLVNDRTKKTLFPLLPPLKYPISKKTVVLDLDNTLIYNIKGIGGDPPKIYDFSWHGSSRVFYILKRPFVDEFLQCLSENNFEIVVFTAATEGYASKVLDFLDPSKGLIKHRLYRDSCYNVKGGRIKDLSLLGRDLRKVVIVDDRPISYIFNRKNAIPIKPFIDDLQDDELMNLMGYFRQNRDEEFFKDFEMTKDYRINNDSWSEMENIPS